MSNKRARTNSSSSTELCLTRRCRYQIINRLPNMAETEHFDLIIIGAGPAGLSAAETADREGLNYLVLEKGTIADTIRQYPVGRTLFSTPNELEMRQGS